MKLRFAMFDVAMFDVGMFVVIVAAVVPAMWPQRSFDLHDAARRCAPSAS